MKTLPTARPDTASHIEPELFEAATRRACRLREAAIDDAFRGAASSLRALLRALRSTLLRALRSTQLRALRSTQRVLRPTQPRVPAQRAPGKDAATCRS